MNQLHADIVVVHSQLQRASQAAQTRVGRQVSPGAAAADTDETVTPMRTCGDASASAEAAAEETPATAEDKKAPRTRKCGKIAPGK